MELLFSTCVIAALCLPDSAAADWPEWRGQGRTGALSGGPPLVSSWPATGPNKLWESEPLPEEGGWGSVVVAGQRVFLFVNWHSEEPFASRTIDKSVLSRLNWFDPEAVDAEVLKKLEAARQSRSAELRGRKLDEWIKTWLEGNLTKDQHKKWRRELSQRLKDGPEATPLTTFRALATIRDRRFDNQVELDACLENEKIDSATRKRLARVIPTAKKIAQDVLLCLDAATGKTLWKAELPGKPSRNDGSSTPCVARGRLFVIGTTHASCLDARSGSQLWSTPLERGGSPSSFALADNLAAAFVGHLVAFDVETGAIAWEQKDVRGKNSSPTVWRHGEKSYFICHSTRREAVCVDAKTGAVLWKVPGGGDSSPVVTDGYLVLHTKSERGLCAYRLDLDAPKLAWSYPLEGRAAATPSVHKGHVYLLAETGATCVELATGKESWSHRLNAGISSPVVADDKLIAVTRSGRALTFLGATPAAYEEKGNVRVRAARCASPAIAEGRLFVREQHAVVAYDLRAP